MVYFFIIGVGGVSFLSFHIRSFFLEDDQHKTVDQKFNFGGINLECMTGLNLNINKH